MNDWTQIIRDHEKTVFGTAWRILGHVQDTEDVVQEVYLSAHRLYRTEKVHHWGALLRKLATCRALDRLRRRRHTLPLDGSEPAGPADGPEEALLEQELLDRLRHAVGQLQGREAEVFCLHYFEQLPGDQIADVLETSRGAVANALYKARSRLETLFTSQWR
ncbi:MAG: RNA polymerase sigma factor [Gemmataceae bacterium]